MEQWENPHTHPSNGNMTMCGIIQQNWKGTNAFRHIRDHRLETLMCETPRMHQSRLRKRPELPYPPAMERKGHGRDAVGVIASGPRDHDPFTQLGYGKLSSWDRIAERADATLIAARGSHVRASDGSVRINDERSRRLPVGDAHHRIDLDGRAQFGGQHVFALH